MRKFAPLALVLTLAVGMLFAAACGGGSSSNTTALLRVVNSVYDSFFAGGGYDVLVDTTSFATALAYKSSSNYTSLTAGSHAVEVRNTGTSADLLNQTISVAGGSSYTYVIAGAGASPQSLMLTDNTTAATTGNIQFRIVNATGAFGAMDVYVTEPGTDIFTVSANDANLGFGATGGYHTLAKGTYEIRITKPGDKTVVYFDSGSIALTADGAVVTFIIEGSGTNPGGFPLDFQQLTDVAGTSSS